MEIEGGDVLRPSDYMKERRRYLEQAAAHKAIYDLTKALWVMGHELKGIRIG